MPLSPLRIDYDPSLPITAHRAEIAAAVREHPVVVVSGETGSGKSTQLPKICLELGRGTTGMIGHTQPRRIAARSIAARLAQELRVPLGREVGFKVRFTDATGPDTRVKLMTDGVLLAESQGDCRFERYDTIILDEAHERSLNVDFLIGYLRRLLERRKDLKLIITSATIDAARFARHFATAGEPAPVVEVAGRGYPVEVRYRPLVEPSAEDEQPAESTGGEADWLDAVLAAVDELARIDRGDMLIFMPTERDIHETAKALRARPIPGDGPTRESIVLPLYARLSAREQQRVFEPQPRRKIVIATNVAESSLTVPGIRFVIDPGTARLSRYSARSRTQRLPIEPISRASADQRAGRCGRVGPGVCVRLYGERDYLAREHYTPPEIQRTNLASVILQMKALRLGEIERFPLLDPPRRDAVRDGHKTLVELQALDERGELTALGRRLARLPVDPRIGRMILAAEEENCLSEMLVIAAALEVQDPRLRPIEQTEAADAAHAQWACPDSDFLGYLRLWDFYQALKQKLSRGQLRKACQQSFLSPNRMREWLDVHLQLKQLVGEAGMKPRPRRDEPTAIHRAVLAGLLSSVACRGERFDYQTAGGGKANLWPGSATFDPKPRWVVAAEVVETTRRYLRTCARIDPAWIETLGAHLVKRSYGEPHWDATAAAAMAYERVSLFGLIVVPRRRAALAPVDPRTARELMIQHGLVEGQWDRPPRFLEANLALRRRMEKLEHKLRRPGLVRPEAAAYDFYDRRLPADVCDGPRLLAWLREGGRAAADAMRMTEADLLDEPEAADDEPRYPDALALGAVEAPLDYRYEPGAPRDGVTLTVPLEALHQVDPGRLGWLVPGMLEAKVAALVKTLPKPLRSRLVPAAETARRVAGELRFGEGDLRHQLAAALSRLAGASIGPEAFDESRLPDELRMNVEVVDAEGKPTASGRDLGALRRQLAVASAERFAEVEDSRWHRDGIAAWDFGDLPERVEIVSGGLKLLAYPMLVDQGSAVGLRVANDPARAERETRGGLRRLCATAARRELRAQLAWLPKMEEMTLHAAAIPGFDLPGQLSLLAADQAFVADKPVPRSARAFAERLDEGRRAIGLAVQALVEVVPPLLAGYHRARLALEKLKAPQFAYVAEDVCGQLDRLVAAGFLVETPWAWLRHFPRYFAAVEYRLDKLRGGAAARDRRGFDEFWAWWEAFERRAEEHHAAGIHDPELELFRWMLEEYRVRLFAEPLGTAVPTSAKRLAKQWERVRT